MAQIHVKAIMTKPDTDNANKIANFPHSTDVLRDTESTMQYHISFLWNVREQVYLE